MRGHVFIAALIESDGEKERSINNVADDSGCSRCYPPFAFLTQTVEYADVKQLADEIGDKACNRDARDKGIQRLQGGEADELPLMKKHGYEIGEHKRRNHDAEDDFARHFCAEDAHGKIRGEEDEGERECAPGRMQFADLEGNLHEDVAGRDDEGMPENKPVKGFLALRRSKGESLVAAVHGYSLRYSEGEGGMGVEALVCKRFITGARASVIGVGMCDDTAAWRELPAYFHVFWRNPDYEVFQDDVDAVFMIIAVVFEGGEVLRE